MYVRVAPNFLGQVQLDGWADTNKASAFWVNVRPRRTQDAALNADYNHVYSYLWHCVYDGQFNADHQPQCIDNAPGGALGGWLQAQMWHTFTTNPPTLTDFDQLYEQDVTAAWKNAEPNLLTSLNLDQHYTTSLRNALQTGANQIHQIHIVVTPQSSIWSTTIELFTLDAGGNAQVFNRITVDNTTMPHGGEITPDPTVNVTAPIPPIPRGAIYARIDNFVGQMQLNGWLNSSAANGFWVNQPTSGRDLHDFGDTHNFFQVYEFVRMCARSGEWSAAHGGCSDANLLGTDLWQQLNAQMADPSAHNWLDGVYYQNIKMPFDDMLRTFSSPLNPFQQIPAAFSNGLQAGSTSNVVHINIAPSTPVWALTLELYTEQGHEPTVPISFITVDSTTMPSGGEIAPDPHVVVGP